MLGKEAEIAIISPWPSSPDTQGRDEKGSTAPRPEALTGVVTVAIRVVRPPRDKSRSVPVWPVGSSGTFGPGGDTTLRVQTKTLRSRGSDRDYPHLFQEEMMRMTQGWTGLRTAVIALGLFACASTGAKADSILSMAPPDRSIPRRQRRSYGLECDQLCPDHERLSRRQLEHLPGLFPGCRTGRPASRRPMTTRRSASPTTRLDRRAAPSAGNRPRFPDS